MLRFFIAVCFTQAVSFAYSFDPVFEMKRSWVISLKALHHDMEKKESHLLVQNEKVFFKKFNFISPAWADSRYDCFYAGWASQKKNNLCQHPNKVNPLYSKSNCKLSEFQCQPLMFGKGLCVSNIDEKDKRSLFSRCEEKFKNQESGSYDFLKKISREELDDFRENSVLAAEICKDKKTEACLEVMNKFKRAMSAIDQSYLENKTTKNTTKPAPKKNLNNDHDQNCSETSHGHENLINSINRALTKNETDELYEKIKAEFLSSPFCDPSRVLNDPNERPVALLLKDLYDDLKNLDPLVSNAPKNELVDNIINKYRLSMEIKEDVITIIGQMGKQKSQYEQNRLLIAKVKGIILQNFVKNYKNKPEDKENLAISLADEKIFRLDENDNPECPFVTKDAFEKAISGRKEVLKKYGDKIPNKNIMTIVDYTRPSNERRLFVIDISTGKVLHNTWVAHGMGGGDHGKGEDGFGSHPKMSNTPGSMQSSDGFIIAKAKSEGKLFGKNLILSGIDKGNSNLAARSVVMHGWDTPFASYTQGISYYDSDEGPLDVIENLKKIDFKNTTREEAEKAVYSVNSSLYTAPHMAPTEGCLGVSTANIKHLDRKGRDKGQLELLRDDLPGSIIFNYSGPEMKSNFFD